MFFPELLTQSKPPKKFISPHNCNLDFKLKSKEKKKVRFFSSGNYHIPRRKAVFP